MGGVSSIPEEDIPSTLIQLWRERAQELSWKERERLAAALQAVREASMVDDQPNGRPSIACKPTEIEFLTNLIQHLDAAEGVHSGILESSGIGGGFADANIDADRSESESSGEDGHGVSSSDNDQEPGNTDIDVQSNAVVGGGSLVDGHCGGDGLRSELSYAFRLVEHARGWRSSAAYHRFRAREQSRAGS